MKAFEPGRFIRFPTGLFPGDERVISFVAVRGIPLQLRRAQADLAC